jgi:hypothetical protein
MSHAKSLVFFFLRMTHAQASAGDRFQGSTIVLTRQDFAFAQKPAPRAHQT